MSCQLFFLLVSGTLSDSFPQRQNQAISSQSNIRRTRKLLIADRNLDVQPFILVVGSINADVIIEVDRLPQRDETLVAKKVETGFAVPGGKGANQAVACARMCTNSDVSVKFVCQLGNDSHADMLLAALRDNNVDVSAVKRVERSSGTGFVMLEPDGSATSIVVGGANAMWPAELEELRQLVQGASAVLLQREIPEFVNEAVASIASDFGIPVLLDAGGEGGPISNKLLQCATFVAPNEGELERLSGLSTKTNQEVMEGIKNLQARGAQNVLVTLGSQGALLVPATGGEQPLHVPALAAPLVADATGAGDAFRAAFVVGLVEGKSIHDCMRMGSAAGAVAVSRHGGIPAMPTRAECDAILQHEKATAEIANGLRGGKSPTDCPVGPGGPLEFASRLNSMKARLDLWDGPSDTLNLVRRQGKIKGLTMVDFNYPQHLEGLSIDDVKKALQDAGLVTGAVCMRYPSDMRAGAFTNPDSEVRNRAIQLTKEGCNWAISLGARELVVWSAFDGYDYNLQADHTLQWDRMVCAFRELCDEYPMLRISLEFKPTDENCRYFSVPSTGAALLLANDIGRKNFGLTLDVGHCIMAGENPAQSAALAAARGRLFGVQLNDGHQRLGAEDGLMFSSVHSTMALELMLVLRKFNYDGHMYFDTFPRNEDPIREAEYNIRRVIDLWEKAGGLEAAGVDRILRRQDALASLEMLEGYI